MRILCKVAAAALLCLTASATAAARDCALNDQGRCRPHSATIRGHWVGTGYQSGTRETWTIDMVIGERRSTVAYPSLRCGGYLERIRFSNTFAQFREHITYGRKTCVNRGILTLRLSRGRLVYRWQGMNEGRPDSATGTLTRRR